MPSETPISFARNKTHPPKFRGAVVARKDLEERVGAALLSCRLVLLVAAAGYGKTAALSHALSKLAPACPSVWIAMDEHDDLHRFLACLLDALEVHDPPWRVAPESLVERVSKEAGLRPVVDELVNTLAAVAVEHSVIALDDMHRVTDPRVCEFLELLLQRAPPNWTVAIATRVEPALPLARLRAHRELAEFGPSDLSFTQAEIRSLWAASGQDDSDATAQGLFERTQGWVAGLCLTLDVARRSGAPAADRRLSQRHLFDYLASEVFEQMSDGWREFLMRCSVLPELTAARCAKVSGDPRAGRMLEEIERRGIFVSVLEGRELTLRPHDLFRDFLDDRLRREHPEEIPQLLRRAAEDEWDPARKVDMLLRAGSGREAEELLFEVAPTLLAKGETAQVTRLIEQFPAAAQTRSPRLAFTRGLLALCNLSVQLLSHMDDAATGFEQEGDSTRMWRARAHLALGSLLFPIPLATASPHPHPHPVERAHEILAALDAVDTSADLETDLAAESCRFWRAAVDGPPTAVEQHLRNIVDLLTSGASPEIWFRFFPWLSPHIATPGVRALAERLAAGALRVAGDSYLPLQLLARNVEAVLLVWQGRVDDAESLIRRLQEDEQWAGRPAISLLGSWIVAETLNALRNGARPKVATIDQIVSGRMSTTANGAMGILGITTSNGDLVKACVAGIERHGDLRGSFWPPFVPLFKAWLALERRREEEALQLLAGSVRTSGQLDRFGLDAMVRIFLAIAEMRTGHAEAAWAAVEPLVHRISQDGEVMGVLLCGCDTLAELARAPWPRAASPEALAEMQRWVDLSRQLRAGAAEDKTAERPSGMLLSARELEVLAHIAEGDSNKLIARALDLSPHTVKRHVARILDRLDLASRGEAAAWYHRHHHVRS